jgi:hypothetical protein
MIDVSQPGAYAWEVISIILFIILGCLLIFYFAYRRSVNLCQTHPNPWCFTDWKCNVPSDGDIRTTLASYGITADVGSSYLTYDIFKFHKDNGCRFVKSTDTVGTGPDNYTWVDGIGIPCTGETSPVVNNNSSCTKTSQCLSLGCTKLHNTCLARPVDIAKAKATPPVALQLYYSDLTNITGAWKIPLT